uniref:Death domain-containing protein n=1 Tax=Branchiostoma floridae TaxID=7739 RepID=C3ZU32_BRAFL|eukprot:XP_002587907.1 hypothetical protein BRAFLDRAFT_87295 [Branchiostoma floridae]
MKLFCLHLLPREQRAQLKRMVDVFHKLMELDKIDQENLEFIEEILERIGRQDLIRDVLRRFQPPDREIPENPELQPETPELQPEIPGLQPGTTQKLADAEGDVQKHFDYVIEEISHKWDDMARKLGFHDNKIKEIQDSERDHSHRCREILTRWRNREGRNTTSNTYVVVDGTVRMIQETLDHLKNCLATLCGTRRSQVKFRGYKKHKSILVHFSIPRENTAVLRHMADHSDPRLVYMGVKSLQIDAKVPIKVTQGAPLYGVKRQLTVDDIEVGCSNRTKHQRAPQGLTSLSALNLFSDALPLHLQAAASLEYQGFSYSLVRALVQKDRLREHQMRQAFQNLRNAEVDSNTLRQKAEVDSNTIMTLRSKLNITENRLKEALESIAVLEEKLQQAQEYAEKVAKQVTSDVTEYRGEKPPGGWPQEYRGEKPPGGWPQEYRGEKPPGGWPQEYRGEKPPGGWPQEYRGEKPPGGWSQEYRGEKPPGGWSVQAEKADSATETHLTDPVGTTGIPGDVGGDEVGADPTVKKEDGKTPRQDAGSGSDGKEDVLGTEAPMQEQHTAGTEETASGSTGAWEQPVITFGGKGSEPGKFDYPRGVVVSPGNEIFVADKNRRVQVHSTEGVYLRHFPTVVPGTGDKDMKPHDVCMDGNGTLWVVGRGETAHHVVQYSTDGTAMAGFDLQKGYYDRGIAVDMRTNHILVTDCDQGTVHVFRPDGSLVRTVRHPRGEMIRPGYVTVDGEGNILVSDWRSYSVYVHDESGKFLFQFGGEGSGEGQLKWPAGICTDSSGHILVADSWNERVQIFTRHGEFVRTVRTRSSPEGLAVGPEGQLVVTNHLDHTVAIYTN